MKDRGLVPVRSYTLPMTWPGWWASSGNVPWGHRIMGLDRERVMRRYLEAMDPWLIHPDASEAVRMSPELAIRYPSLLRCICCICC